MTEVVIRAVVAFLALGSPEVEVGRLSVYWPGDSFTAADSPVMACDTPRRPRRYRRGSVHIAHREWRRLGCGTPVLVCARLTKRCAWAEVADGGPWGIYRGKLAGAVREGRWKVWTRPRPPEGWRWRAVADLSRALWKRLGRPRALSEVVLVYHPRRPRGRR